MAFTKQTMTIPCLMTFNLCTFSASKIRKSQIPSGIRSWLSVSYGVIPWMRQVNWVQANHEPSPKLALPRIPTPHCYSVAFRNDPNVSLLPLIKFIHTPTCDSYIVIRAVTNLYSVVATTFATLNCQVLSFDLVWGVFLGSRGLGQAAWNSELRFPMRPAPSSESSAPIKIIRSLVHVTNEFGFYKTKPPRVAAVIIYKSC